ncbi:MAG: sigma-70 family RNA polymerase sigma factor [Prolixibacteraceae bacterium]|nr:sigma-70 family RNA polymerase sigma factor [Prolixibacteraceae bacterium]MBN2774031.1 sigma-70 family RNA polymerase sigma factor [Prolixibacteraceae bacterium]
MDNLYIKKVLNGETEEFRYFIKKYKDMAFSVSMSVLKDEFLAADVVQESFVKAFQNLGSFKGKSKFSSWFYRIVINESFKVFRKRKEVQVEAVTENENEPIDTFNAIEEFKEEERRYFINKSINHLPANESLVLRLFYLNENSIKEICEITGWSESNVKVLMHRGRLNMQKSLFRLLKTEAKLLI